ncbi:hypothetical protein ES702_03178 [subsurface metagenome]
MYYLVHGLFLLKSADEQDEQHMSTVKLPTNLAKASSSEHVLSPTLMTQTTAFQLKSFGKVSIFR